MGKLTVTWGADGRPMNYRHPAPVREKDYSGWSPSFSDGQCVVSVKSHPANRVWHVFVHSTINVGPNENIVIEWPDGSREAGLACRWKAASYGSRRACSGRCCKGWNLLSWWQRVCRVDEFVPADA